jgi:hypothetical protein
MTAEFAVHALATIACMDFVSCEVVKLRGGRLIHTRHHYTIPTGALQFFDADVLDEKWVAA